MEPTAITHLERKMIFQTSIIMVQPLIFQGESLGSQPSPMLVTTKVLHQHGIRSVPLMQPWQGGGG